jgi:transposase
MPAFVRTVLQAVTAQLKVLLQMRVLEAELLAWHRTNVQSQRLATITGIGSVVLGDV